MTSCHQHGGLEITFQADAKPRRLCPRTRQLLWVLLRCQAALHAAASCQNLCQTAFSFLVSKPVVVYQEDETSVQRINVYQVWRLTGRSTGFSEPHIYTHARCKELDASHCAILVFDALGRSEKRPRLFRLANALCQSWWGILGSSQVPARFSTSSPRLPKAPRLTAFNTVLPPLGDRRRFNINFMRELRRRVRTSTPPNHCEKQEHAFPSIDDERCSWT